MYYKQFSNIIKVLNEELICEFDYWLATLPSKNQKGITISFIASKFDIDVSIAQIIVDCCVKHEIFQEEFLIRCSNDACEMPLEHIGIDQVAD